MDNGKSIRESRDLDIPIVARHFYHHAGTSPISVLKARHVYIFYNLILDFNLSLSLFN